MTKLDFLVAGMALGVIAVLGLHLTLEPPLNPKELDQTAKLAWYKWYFSEYAAELRRQQYGEGTLDINALLIKYSREFKSIDSVAIGLLYPPPSNGSLTSQYIYFGARTLPLETQTGISFYATSYIGSARFAHSDRAFDAIIMPDQIKRGETALTKEQGLAARWIAERGVASLDFETPGDQGSSRPLSYNSGDLDRDGDADFMFGDWLILSSRGYKKSSIAPRRSIFSGDKLISLVGDRLEVHTWNGESLVKGPTLGLSNQALEKLPHVLLPLPDNKVAVRTSRGLDMYVVSSDQIRFYCFVSGLVDGEVQTGAFGDFDGDGVEDFWISQVATPLRGTNSDYLSLISLGRIKEGENEIRAVRLYTIRGSSKFSDYDGISSTLSPRAGDIDGDGRPDITFTGHRHMNEAGALYAVLAKDITSGGEIDITAPQVIRILGRPMSQLAPPFQHWDATDVDGDGCDDIIVAADNDLRSGINAGAIYILSGKLVSSAQLHH